MEFRFGAQKGNSTKFGPEEFKRTFQVEEDKNHAKFELALRRRFRPIPKKTRRAHTTLTGTRKRNSRFMAAEMEEMEEEEEDRVSDDSDSDGSEDDSESDDGEAGEDAPDMGGDEGDTGDGNDENHPDDTNATCSTFTYHSRKTNRERHLAGSTEREIKKCTPAAVRHVVEITSYASICEHEKKRSRK
jgi:hypothetical protein